MIAKQIHLLKMFLYTVYEAALLVKSLQFAIFLYFERLSLFLTQAAFV